MPLLLLLAGAVFAHGFETKAKAAQTNTGKFWQLFQNATKI